MTEREVERLKVVVRLIDFSHEYKYVTVDDVEALLNCGEIKANEIMHELTLLGVAKWSTVQNGTLIRDKDFNGM